MLVRRGRVRGAPSILAALAIILVASGADAGNPRAPRPTTIELGPNDGTNQGVASGLFEDQLIVSGGIFALKSELYR